MINKISKIVFLAVLFALAVPVNAALEAEYNKLMKTWTLNADGSQDFHYHMELTLFTHTAMNSTYGESFIIYNPKYQSLVINESYTKQKDGTIVKTPTNAFVEVLPKNAANAPAYNHLKEMVVVHTGLELGATIYLDYTIKSKAGYLGALDIFETIKQSSPVREYNLQVVVPENVELSYSSNLKKAKAHSQVCNGMRHVTWNLHNISASSKADFVQLENGDVPYLAVTTFPSVKDALRMLHAQFDQSTVSDMSSLAAELTKGQQTVDGKIRSVWNFVNRQIASNPLTLEQTGYRLRSAQDVLNSAYGTKVEKVNLLVSLLREAGISSRPLAVYPFPEVKGTGLKAVKDFYVAIDGTPYLLGVQSLSRPTATNSGIVPLYDLSSGNLIQPTESADYKIRGDYTISIADEKYEIKRKERVGKSLLSYFSEGVEEKTEKGTFSEQQGYETFVLPESNYGLSRLPYGKLNSIRDVNLLIPRPVDEVYVYSIECGEDVHLCTSAKSTNIINSAGQINLSIRKMDGRIIVERKLNLCKQIFTPSEYKDLRSLLITWYDLQGRTLLFSIK